MLKKFFKNPLYVFVVASFLTLGGSLLFAAPPDSPYAPGDTLDPNCAPGDPNCSVLSSPSTGSGLLLTNNTLSVSGLSTGNFTSPNVSQWTNDSGYITSYTETDPVFTASVASGITGGNVTNWNTAFGWGNHALEGYYGPGNPIRLSYVEEGSFTTNYSVPSSNNSTMTGWEARITATEAGAFQYVKHSGSSSPELYRLNIYEANASWVKGALISSTTGISSEVINTRTHVVFEANFNFLAGQNYIFEMPPATGSARQFLLSTDSVIANGTHVLGPLNIVRQRGPVSNTYSLSWQFHNSENIPKSVVGPLDPVDLPGYGLSTVGQVLSRTANGAEFVNVSTGNFTSPNVSQWTNDANYISDISTFDATNLSIVDSANYFTATTVETALAELFSSDSNAFSLLNKPRLSGIAAAVVEENRGSSPMSVSDTYVFSMRLESEADTSFSHLQFKYSYQVGTQVSMTAHIYEADGSWAKGNLVAQNTTAALSESMSIDPYWFEFDFDSVDAPTGSKFIVEFTADSSTASANPYMSTDSLVANAVTQNGAFTFSNFRISGTSWAFSVRVGSSGSPKGVVGPLDEADLPGYGLATTGQVLARTANGAEFVNVSTGNFSSPNVSQWTNDANYISDISTFDATNLSIVDSANYFTATTVETALAELFASDSNAFSLLNKPSLSFVSGPAEDLDPTPVATNTTFGGGIEVTAYSFTPAENTTLYGLVHKTTTGTGYTIKARVWKQAGPEFVGETGYVTYSSGEYRAVFNTPIILEAGVTYRIGFAGSLYTIAASTTATSYDGFTTLNGTGYYSSTGVDTYPSSTISGYWSPWTLIIAGNDVQKGVTGPLDPNDLANYENAATNTFLRKTASGLEFTSIGVEQQVFSYSPLGSGVSEGAVYINPIQLGASGLVQWTTEVGWNLTSSAYGNPSFADLDGDGDLDVAIGIDTGATLMYENAGTPLAPVWTRNTIWETGIAGVGARSAPAFADLDGDGDYDLMIGNEEGTTLGYRNTGTPLAPVWTREAAWDIGDIGSRTNPELVDLDNDGDYDLLIGAQTTSGTTYAYENTGNASSPTWVRNAGWDPPSVNFYASPTAGDLDGDGDFDLLIGAGNGNGVSYAYENIGSVTAPIWSAKSSWNLPDIGSWAYPELGDLDGDGDLDILIGDHNNIVRAYKNTGSLGAVSNTLLGVAVDGTEKFRINGSGDVFAAGDISATGFINTSTEEAKASITFLSVERERNILSDIRTLDIANYRYLTDGAGEPLRLGLIAERSPSEILSRDGMGVDLYKLSTFTLAGLKSLTEKVDGIEKLVLLTNFQLDTETLDTRGSLFNIISDALRDAVLRVKELFASKIYTSELCIDDICFTAEEAQKVKALLEEDRGTKTTEPQAETPAETPDETTNETEEGGEAELFNAGFPTNEEGGQSNEEIISDDSTIP